MKTESKLKHYRNPRNCNANCDWPKCSAADCVDPDAPHGEFYKSMGEVFLAMLAVSMVLMVLVGLVIKSCAS